MIWDEIEKMLDESSIRTDYLVALRYRYDFESEWTRSNELLLFGEFGDYYWQDDWYEGQQHIEVDGIIPISEIVIEEVTIL